MPFKDRSVKSIPLTDLAATKSRLLHWSAGYEYCSFLDSNQDDQDRYAKYEWLIAVGAKTVCEASEEAFDQLNQFYASENDWIFGHFSYDLKNQIENLESRHSDSIGFSELSFFVPQHIFILKKDSNQLEILSLEDPDQVWESIQSFTPKLSNPFTVTDIQLLTDESTYLKDIEKIRNQIEEGDFYEMNYCLTWEGTGQGDLVGLYERLNQKDKSPFAAFYKAGGRHLLCSSLERYLQKTGDTIISQPIKGTIRRLEGETDEDQKSILRTDEKEKAENVMIVDLVRNDLNRIAKRGTVSVPELFGIYSFEHVHHMISTVAAQLDDSNSWIDAIRASFPMGSMTGAPKIMVMEMIEAYENRKRGLYSGALGYVDPNGDFDFNVVIRSIQFNEGSNALCFQTGGAITYDSVAEKEWKEVWTKAQGMLDALSIVNS